MADITDLVPVSKAEFAAEITPCLALASGAGMSPGDQRVWLAAAYRALDGIPIALLKRGCVAAMRSADHPSKIVPAIIAAVRDDWDWRRRYSRPASIAHGDQATARPAGERASVAKSMGELLAKLQTTPSDADTIMGLRKSGENKK